MKISTGIGLSLLLLVGGCPQPQSISSSSVVSAIIGISSTTGPAPLMLAVTAIDSTSLNGDTLLYYWDFGDGTTSDKQATSHTYTQPGRYLIKLEVTDEAGEVGVAAVDVQVQGG